jgi:deoxyribonuclease V
LPPWILLVSALPFSTRVAEDGRGQVEATTGHHASVDVDVRRWPATAGELVELQLELGREAGLVVAAGPWELLSEPLVGGCFVAFARGEAGPGKPGDRAWAAAVLWRSDCPNGEPLARTVVAGRVPAAYAPGLLALREGPVLGAAVAALELRPDVLLVDATGLDHPRRAGLAVHLGATADVPTVGVTHRPLVATGDPPKLQRGLVAPVHVDGDCVGYWTCTRDGARAVVAHAAWRTTPETAAQTVLAASMSAARTPIPLQEARRVARERRARDA